MSAQGPEETSTEGKNQARVDPKLLEILVCPLTKGPLRFDAQANELISDRAGLAYPIRDGIPIMLIDEARRIDEHAGKAG
ncbi:Trm112 family protein [Azospirillum sp.]|uniref:Trm112 family protein n=1 Tax=Azospirillum sp. TaxID=34012 RepID=UPI002D49FA0C|nr:Trm112 family protein [Azospirillum sp.]HYD70694.1 Trm112 family protein [Azospirillum sp.]